MKGPSTSVVARIAIVVSVIGHMRAAGGTQTRPFKLAGVATRSVI